LLEGNVPFNHQPKEFIKMIRTRHRFCISLLCALAFCAFAAQGASAAAAKNTTVYACLKGNTKDFSEEHCVNGVTPGTGGFGHEAVTVGDLTALSIGNEKTASETTAAAPTILKGTVFGVKNEITCTKVAGEGSLTNSEPVAKEHRVAGSITAKFTSCTVNKPAGFGCKVKEPITVKSNVEGVEGLGAGKNEMGLEFKPSEGEIFSSVVIEGCFLAGTYNTTGTAIGTGTPAPTAKHSGATNVFTNAMTKETLKLAGNPAEVSSTTTVNMSGGGNPVALTTTT
jgi:hypothetical protein